MSGIISFVYTSKNMPTEISEIDVSSVHPIAFALGFLNGFILSLPMIWNWLQYGEWITGIGMGIGMFTFGVLISILITAIVTVILAAVFVVAYNLVASAYGGIEVRLQG